MTQRKKNALNKTTHGPQNHILEKLYYEVDRPSALGGVQKLYQAAQKYGISRPKVVGWLQKQPGYTLHRPARKTFRRNRVFVNGLDQQWQADLADVQKLSRWNRGYKYLLTCIDVLSKYAWVVPLKQRLDLVWWLLLKRYSSKDANQRHCKQMLSLNSRTDLSRHFSRATTFDISSRITKQRPKLLRGSIVRSKVSCIGILLAVARTII